MRLRIIVWIVFVVVVTAASIVRHYCCTQATESAAEWIATASLPRNSLIETNHLEKPAFRTPADSWALRNPAELIGKYTVRGVRMGEVITPQTLTAFPAILEQTNAVLLFFPAPDLAGASIQLNAGATVRISDGTNDFGPFVVATVFGRSQAATLLVRVATTNAFAVQKLVKPQVRVVTLP